MKENTPDNGQESGSGEETSSSQTSQKKTFDHEQTKALAETLAPMVGILAQDNSTEMQEMAAGEIQGFVERGADLSVIVMGNRYNLREYAESKNYTTLAERLGELGLSSSYKEKQQALRRKQALARREKEEDAKVKEEAAIKELFHIVEKGDDNTTYEYLLDEKDKEKPAANVKVNIRVNEGEGLVAFKQKIAAFKHNFPESWKTLYARTNAEGLSLYRLAESLGKENMAAHAKPLLAGPIFSYVQAGGDLPVEALHGIDRHLGSLVELIDTPLPIHDNPTGHTGRTLYQVAEESENFEVADNLFTYSAEQLFASAKKDGLETFKKTIAAHELLVGDITHLKNNEGQNLLHVALENENWEVAGYLGRLSSRPLFDAIRQGDEDAFYAQIETYGSHHISIFTNDEGENLLQAAERYNHPQITGYIRNILAKPLFEAVEKSRDDIARFEFLVNAIGGRLGDLTHLTDGQGRNLLDVANAAPKNPRIAGYLEATIFPNAQPAWTKLAETKGSRINTSALEAKKPDAPLTPPGEEWASKAAKRRENIEDVVNNAKKERQEAQQPSEKPASFRNLLKLWQERDPKGPGRQ